MENINKILDLDYDFIKKYKNININEDNIDEFSKDVDVYDITREKLIHLVNLNELQQNLKSEEIKNLINKLKQNQKESTEIIIDGQNYCKKNIGIISKTKKINIYKMEELYESNFIDIIK